LHTLATAAHIQQIADIALLLQMIFNTCIIAQHQETTMILSRLVLIAAIGGLMSSSVSANARPSNESSLGNIEPKAGSIFDLASRKNPAGRCRADFRRDRFGYCVPNWNA
jgi:hypothetical protein